MNWITTTGNGAITGALMRSIPWWGHIDQSCQTGRMRARDIPRLRALRAKPTLLVSSASST